MCTLSDANIVVLLSSAAPPWALGAYILHARALGHAQPRIDLLDGIAIPPTARSIMVRNGYMYADMCESVGGGWLMGQTRSLMWAMNIHNRIWKEIRDFYGLPASMRVVAPGDTHSNGASCFALIDTGIAITHFPGLETQKSESDVLTCTYLWEGKYNAIAAPHGGIARVYMISEQMNQFGVFSVHALSPTSEVSHSVQQAFPTSSLCTFQTYRGSLIFTHPTITPYASVAMWRVCDDDAKLVTFKPWYVSDHHTLLTPETRVVAARLDAGLLLCHASVEGLHMRVGLLSSDMQRATLLYRVAIPTQGITSIMYMPANHEVARKAALQTALIDIPIPVLLIIIHYTIM